MLRDRLIGRGARVSAKRPCLRAIVRHRGALVAEVVAHIERRRRVGELLDHLTHLALPNGEMACGCASAARRSAPIARVHGVGCASDEMGSSLDR